MDIEERRRKYREWYKTHRKGKNQIIENLPNEEWRDVVYDRLGKHYDFSGQYQISNYGRLKSLERDVLMKDGRNKHCYERIIKPHVARNYYQFQFDKENIINQHTTIVANRLVALIFLTVPDRLRTYNIDDLEVNHIDENTKNNHVSNLEWVTKIENANWGTVKNRRVKTTLSNDPNLKKKKNKLKETSQQNGLSKPCSIINLKTNKKLDFKSINDAAIYVGKLYNKDGMKLRGNIWKCLKGFIKSAYGYKWELI